MLRQQTWMEDNGEQRSQIDQRVLKLSIHYENHPNFEK